MISVQEVLGLTRNGGSCSECGDDYRGSPHTDRRGRRVLAEISPGVVEPVNLCKDCFHAEVSDD